MFPGRERHLLRTNSKEIQGHVETHESESEIRFTSDLNQMFGGINGYLKKANETLTQEEEQDVKNFLTYCAKRLSQYAIVSKAYAGDVQAGDTSAALREWAPTNQRGHDALHAMLAYARNGGKSIMPAHMQVEGKGDEYNDQAALLEEKYVSFFSALQTHVARAKPLLGSLRKNPDPVLSLVESYEESEIGTGKLSLEYARQHRLPEFVNIVRKIYEEAQKETADPKVGLHEFQRILAPLLKRLRTKSQAAASG